MTPAELNTKLDEAADVRANIVDIMASAMILRRIRPMIHRLPFDIKEYPPLVNKWAVVYEKLQQEFTAYCQCWE